MDKLEEKSQKLTLSNEEKAKIAAKVAAKLEKEARIKLEEAYEKQLIAEAKREEFLKNAEPGKADEDGNVPIYIDLPSVSPCIRLDGRAFYPQRIYYVKPEVADTINEIMWRGKEHEDSINGKPGMENRQRRTSNAIVK